MVKGAVEIYRSPMRVNFYRGFGLFCFGHAVAWFGLTSYRILKQSPTDDSVISGQLKDVIGHGPWPFKRAKKKDDDDDGVSTEPNQNETIAVEKYQAPAWTKYNPSKWINSRFPQLERLSAKVHEQEHVLIPCLTFMFGLFTLAAGVYFPRRVVRRITLIPSPTRSDGTPKLKQKYLQHAEIQTYGAFGARHDGVTFQIPVSDISAVQARSVNYNFLHFRVKGKPFQFYVEKAGAEFPLPDEFDFTFALKRDN